jgi:hypothetical protein
MGSEAVGKGRLYANKNKMVFVASSGGALCPTINITRDGKSAKFKDDYSKGLKISKAFVKLIFK